ncbi:MAG: heme ABC exporter ATP-binding protein CcmA [Bdellovibrionales bacterium]
MISISNLRLVRGLHSVAENFSATLGSGQGAWLLGANGSGKTSLLRSIAGLLPPVAGSLKVDSQFIYIGSIAGHDATLTTQENLEFWCAINNTDVLPAGVALEHAGLTRMSDKRADSLSAGQAQRLALARLLCAHAKLWLLDEPFSSLDAAGCEWLKSLLLKHFKDGGSAVIATHQTYEIPNMQSWVMS